MGRLSNKSNLESSLQKVLLQRLEAEGIWAVKIVVANKRGVPDVLALHNGKFIAIEVKRPTQIARHRMLSSIQEHCLSQIRKSKGYTFVIFEYSDIDNLINAIRSL